MSQSKFVPDTTYDLSVYDTPAPAHKLSQPSLRSVKLDYDLYLLVDKWKARLRAIHPGHPITIRAIFNRGIYLVCKELEAKYGAPE